jgi:hypothetical protein
MERKIGSSVEETNASCDHDSSVNILSMCVYLVVYMLSSDLKANTGGNRKREAKKPVRPKRRITPQFKDRRVFVLMRALAIL